MGSPPDSSKVKKKKPATANRKPYSRAGVWIVCLLASALLLVSLGSYWWHHEQLADIASQQLRLVVTGPPLLQAETPACFTVSTAGVTGKPMPSQIELAIFSPTGKQLLEQKDKTGEDGGLSIMIPADLKAPNGSRLEVLAVCNNKLERMDARLAVEKTQLATHLATDKAVYRPGDTVRYRSLTLSRFGLSDPRRTIQVQFEIRDSSGAVVPGSEGSCNTGRSVASGEFQLPKEIAEGEYALVAKSPAFAEEKYAFAVEKNPLSKLEEADKDKPPQVYEETVSEAIPIVPEPAASTPIAPVKTIVEFFPEGGQLAAGLENRVYFTAQDESGHPVELEAKLVDTKGNDIAIVKTSYAGMGSFSLRPAAGTSYRLDADLSKVFETQLPPAKPNVDVVLTTGSGVFEADGPMEFNVRARRAGLPLVASAWCRGKPVGQTAFVTKGGPNSVCMPLVDGTNGTVRLAVYDYSETPPRILAQRLVYRRRHKRLNIDVKTDKRSYLAGEAAELTIGVTDEKGGAGAGAVLSVDVCDGAASNHIDDERPSMPAHFLLVSAIEGCEGLKDADFYLSDSPRATAALDLLLGTHCHWKPTGQTQVKSQQDAQDGKDIGQNALLGDTIAPPMVFDNMKEICLHYEAGLSDYRTNRTRIHNAITAVGVFAGLALLLLTAMMSLLGVAGGLKVWAPSLAAAAACVAMGAVLVNPNRPGCASNNVAEFVSFSAKPNTKIDVYDGNNSTEASSSSIGTGIENNPNVAGRYANKNTENEAGGVVKTLFWNPLAICNELGVAKIKFDFPRSALKLRISVDGHSGVTGIGGDKKKSENSFVGRIGSNRDEVTVQNNIDNKQTAK